MRRKRILFLAALVSQCGSAWAAGGVTPIPASKVPPPCAVVMSRGAKIRKPELVPANKVLTVDDCICLALQNQPTLREAQAQLEISAGAVSVSGSALRPSVNFDASEALAGSSGRNSLTNNGSVSQLLYDFGKSRSLLTGTEQTQLSDYYSLMATSNSVANTVKQDYYALLKSNRLVEVYKENLKDQNDHVSQAQALLTAGTGPRADVLTAQANAASASVDLINAQNTTDQALVTLNAAMGVDIRSQTRIAEYAEPEILVPPLDDAVVQGIKNRPEVAESVEVVNSDISALKAANTGNDPAFFGVGSGEQVVNGSTLGNGWQLALNLQWTPFDFGQVSGQVAEAAGQLMLAEEELYATRQSVSQDVASARLNLIAAKAALSMSQAEVASAQENLDVATGRYEAGVGIFLQVTDAQASLLKAQVDETTAQYGLSTAIAQLEYAVGAPLVKGMNK